MIKSLSPYYLYIPFVSPLSGATCTEYTLRVYVWSGLKTSVPSVASYEMTKQNPTTSTGNDKVNIARLVNDFIDFAPIEMLATGLYDAENQRWVKTEVIYNTINPIDFETQQLETITLMLQGYGYGLSGENSQPPTNKILLQGTEFKVQRNGFFNLPILIDETVPPLVEFTLDTITLDSGTDYLFEFTQNFISPTIRILYKISTDTDYIYLDGVVDAVSPILVDLSSLPSETYDFILRAFNPLDSVTYETNSLQITI